MRVTVCHCTWCQRRTGSAFAVESLFNLEQVEISGERTHYRSVSDESERWLELEFLLEVRYEHRIHLRAPARRTDGRLRNV